VRKYDNGCASARADQSVWDRVCQKKWVYAKLQQMLSTCRERAKFTKCACFALKNMRQHKCRWKNTHFFNFFVVRNYYSKKTFLIFSFLVAKYSQLLNWPLRLPRNHSQKTLRRENIQDCRSWRYNWKIDCRQNKHHQFFLFDRVINVKLHYSLSRSFYGPSLPSPNYLAHAQNLTFLRRAQNKSVSEPKTRVRKKETWTF